MTASCSPRLTRRQRPLVQRALIGQPRAALLGCRKIGRRPVAVTRWDRNPICFAGRRGDPRSSGARPLHCDGEHSMTICISTQCGLGGVRSRSGHATFHSPRGSTSGPRRNRCPYPNTAPFKGDMGHMSATAFDAVLPIDLARARETDPYSHSAARTSARTATTKVPQQDDERDVRRSDVDQCGEVRGTGDGHARAHDRKRGHQVLPSKDTGEAKPIQECLPSQHAQRRIVVIGCRRKRTLETSSKPAFPERITVLNAIRSIFSEKSFHIGGFIRPHFSLKIADRADGHHDRPVFPGVSR